MGGETPKLQSNQPLDQLRLGDGVRRHTPHPTRFAGHLPPQGGKEDKLQATDRKRLLGMCEHRSAEAGIQLKPTVVRG